MLFVGLDIHSKRISLCVLSERGQAAHRSQVRSIEEMVRILKPLSCMIPGRLAEDLDVGLVLDGGADAQAAELHSFVAAVGYNSKGFTFARVRPFSQLFLPESAAGRCLGSDARPGRWNWSESV